VTEIGLFATAIDTADNIRNFVGNSKIFGDNIQNYTDERPPPRGSQGAARPRRDPFDAIKRLRERLPKIANVVKEPAPSVEILASPPPARCWPCGRTATTSTTGTCTSRPTPPSSRSSRSAGYPVPKEQHYIEMAAQAAAKSADKP
jgi:hypothetical protein